MVHSIVKLHVPVMLAVVQLKLWHMHVYMMTWNICSVCHHTTHMENTLVYIIRSSSLKDRCIFHLLYFCAVLCCEAVSYFVRSINIYKISNPHFIGLCVRHKQMARHFRHLTDQTKFDQTNLLYIINGEVSESI